MSDTSATELGRIMLDADPLRAQVDDSRVAELVSAALDDGAQLAQATAVALGREPFSIAAQLNIAVETRDDDAGFGTTVIFAEYLSRPPRVYLYRPRIEAVNRLLRDHAPAPLNGLRDATPVFLAHELYHHFDESRGSDALTHRHRVILLSLGRWRWTGGLASLGEIAAGAFAQSLLGLGFHPKLLELAVSGAILEISPVEFA